MTEAGLRRIFRTRRLASGALRVRPGWERQPTPCRGEIDTSTSAGSYQEVPDHDRNHPNERPRPHRRPAPAAAPVPGGTRHAVPGQAPRCPPGPATSTPISPSSSPAPYLASVLGELVIIAHATMIPGGAGERAV